MELEGHFQTLEQRLETLVKCALLSFWKCLINDNDHTSKLVQLIRFKNSADELATDKCVEFLGLPKAGRQGTLVDLGNVEFGATQLVEKL